MRKCLTFSVLILFTILAFFAILHSWLNAFAEMLRFGDRLFYRVSGCRIVVREVFLLSKMILNEAHEDYF